MYSEYFLTCNLLELRWFGLVLNSLFRYDDKNPNKENHIECISSTTGTYFYKWYATNWFYEKLPSFRANQSCG